MKIETKHILNKWELFTLTNDLGMKVSFLNYGGIITEISVPDKQGQLENVVLAYQDYADYENNTNFLGTLVGRIAGRVQGASFTLNGVTHTLEKNEGEHHLHGGSAGFHQVIWQTEAFQTDQAVGVRLTHHSAETSDGYPGNLDVTITYTLTNDNGFSIDYAAVTDQDTALSLTNHSYFNLTGNAKDTIHQHEVTMNSNEFIELDEGLIPTGKILPVDHTSFDFRQGRKLATGIQSDELQNKIAENGYDHYFIFSDDYGDVSVIEGESGRTLTIKTDQPGLVMYTANALTEGLDLVGNQSKAYAGVCFETQASPASLHNNGFPTVLLKKNDTYEKKTTFTFGVTS